MTWNDVVFLLPEIILSIGASFLLIAPVIGWRERAISARWSMLLLLGITGVAVAACSNWVERLPQSPSLAGMFALDAFSIFFKLLFIAAIAMVTLLSDDFLRESRYSVVGVLLAAGVRALRHDVHGLGRPPDLDLHRPGADVALQLHPGRLLQERGEVDRGGDEVFRPRRGQLGDSAVRNLADLRCLRLAESAGYLDARCRRSSPTTR